MITYLKGLSKIDESGRFIEAETIIKECLFCGKEFTARTQRQRNANFCSRRCSAIWHNKNYKFKKRLKEKSPFWKGGKQIKFGYIFIFQGCIPGKSRYRAEHDLIMEKKIKRKIVKNEVVHHINGIKTDNRYKNLYLMTRSKHLSYHRYLENTYKKWNICLGKRI